AAHGGSLFLDEISYLSPEGQAKLLTALETRRVRRLGGAAERQVDLQIIAASSHDMAGLVERGAFRPELLHRLSALWFTLPPLRERMEDAVILAERFLNRATASYHLPPKRLSEGAKAAIQAYGWPGNVRELLHAIERAVLSEDGEVVEASDLALRPFAVAGASVTVDESGTIKVTLPPQGVALEGVERALLEQALAAAKGNVTRAAQLLRITRDTMRSRLEKFGISPQGAR
ncbi:MAG TPA: sigma 54-interacting transcriptional regulator, partial [Myxococcaceae bacterium]|nr:sigma 54-interacting transcriptional regulator [Myxococcaceae bacterium]